MSPQATSSAHRRLYISYRFDTNLPSRAGMQFGVAETAEEERPATRGAGPVYNGRTPSTTVIVSSPEDAYEFVDGHVGRTWATWSLWRVDYPDRAEYHVFPAADPSALKGRRIWGQDATMICARQANGRYVAKSF